MISKEEFDELEVGDVVETESLFPSLTKQAVRLAVHERTKDEIKFVATFLGITLGRFICSVQGKALVWSK